MTPELVVGIVVVAFLALLVLETPVAFALAGSGLLGIALLDGASRGTSWLGSTPFSAVSSYNLAVIPLYILLGMLALYGGLAEKTYALASRALRWIPGGMGIATVAACSGFAAVSGSSVATAASIGKISVTEMRRHGYRVSFAAGIVAVGGTLGILIPPSVALVMYGVVSGESIGQLLAAGVVPGVLSAVVYCLFIALASRRYVVHPGVELSAELSRVGGGSPTGTVIDPVSGADTTGTDLSGSAGTGDRDAPSVFARVRPALWLGIIFLAIFLGIFTGLLTVIESAAVGALVAVVMLAVENRHGGIRGVWRRFVSAVQESASVASMAFMLLVGATIFSTFLVLSRVPDRLAQAIGGLAVPPLIVLCVILLALLVLGTVLETLSLILVAVPLVYPIVIELGYDGVWFGILFVMMVEIGLITPPVGMNVFVVSSSAGVPVETVFRGILPFLVPAIALVALVVTFPQIALWLPSLAVE
ncbi:hypothetical protein AD006_28515 (plasmid) [Pseudonocardia sp. EC080610-09]|uniref:TRAP transporter large permease n=1 Tax=unclassified Pseudonocardia TaxID=2619320 RepID=UPI00070690D8|nr:MULTISPECIES: TRAP transporter large permease [unclassified Pseudonocardia]ALL79272.1 hypothetical protein AD006_28515 [Pseudonocardia sp. EC080610-09]ALL85242.1 hypothetical protein AD017_28905 [Pseudonocardia sp. EC080619-01]